MFITYEKVELDPGSSLRVLYNYCDPRNQGWHYHFHDEIELTCITFGSGLRHVGHDYSSYDNGDLILIGKNLPHSGFGLNASNPHEEIVIQFDESLVTEAQNLLVELKSLPKLLENSKFGVSFYGNTLQYGKNKMREINSAPVHKRVYLLLQLLGDLSLSNEYILLNETLIPAKKVLNAKVRLQTIFSFIEANYAHDFKVKEIADLVGLSIPSFSSYFKRSTSYTFSQWLNNYRIQRACYYLSQGNNVSETCSKCGYNSLSYFIRIFKRVKGITPRQFAQKRNLQYQSS